MRRLTIVSLTLHLMLFGSVSCQSDPTTDSSDTADSSDTLDSSDTEDHSELTRCNGYAALCDKRFNEVTFPATHNSMSNAADEWVVPNQSFAIPRQLSDGIRAFLIDIHQPEDTLLLCHSACGVLGERPLADALDDIHSFLQSNPHEVISFLIQDEASSQDITTAFVDAGFGDMVYTHTPGEQWPTLRTMIETGQRVVVTFERGGPPPKWGHHLWNLAWDTPYSFDSKEAFNCNLNRGSLDNNLFLLNHWISDPLSSKEHAEVANTYQELHNRVHECLKSQNRTPNFIAVDFYEVGGLFRVVRETNGIYPDSPTP